MFRTTKRGNIGTPESRVKDLYGYLVRSSDFTFWELVDVALHPQHVRSFLQRSQQQPRNWCFCCLVFFSTLAIGLHLSTLLSGISGRKPVSARLFGLKNPLGASLWLQVQSAEKTPGAQGFQAISLFGASRSGDRFHGNPENVIQLWTRSPWLHAMGVELKRGPWWCRWFLFTKRSISHEPFSQRINQRGSASYLGVHEILSRLYPQPFSGGDVLTSQQVDEM